MRDMRAGSHAKARERVWHAAMQVISSCGKAVSRLEGALWGQVREALCSKVCQKTEGVGLEMERLVDEACEG